MLTCIDVKFIFDSVPLGLSSFANILQIADVALRVVFLLFLPCFLLLLRLLPAVVFTLERSKVSAMFIFTTKTTQPRSHSALTFKVFHLAKTWKKTYLHFKLYERLKVIITNSKRWDSSLRYFWRLNFVVKGAILWRHIGFAVA